MEAQLFHQRPTDVSMSFGLLIAMRKELWWQFVKEEKIPQRHKQTSKNQPPQA